MLASSDGLTILTIIVFPLFVAASFAALDGSGLLRLVLERVVARLGGRRYTLLLAVSFLFMSLGLSSASSKKLSLWCRWRSLSPIPWAGMPSSVWA